jgi:hypothetical protein
MIKSYWVVALVFFLAACGTPQLPLSKDAPLTVGGDSLVRPPWEALVKAGPDAGKDVDLETLNGTQVAQAPLPETIPADPIPAPEAPKVVHKPTDVQIKAVAVPQVIGALGNGNAELTAAMRKVLQEAGWPVLTTARADALTIQGRVSMDAAQDGQQPVHLSWSVVTPKGKNLGDVKQNNSVPAGSLDAGWGESAGYASQAAATGIFKLIERYR